MVAGILNLVVGSIRLLGFFGVTIAIIVLKTSSYWWSQFEQDVYPMTLEFIVGILIVVAIFIFVAGVLSLLGGIYALQRKKWGLALAGSIVSVFGPIILGIPAIILTAMSKDEFD
jgi:hypothetical protein